jgi:hypothetical protein
MVSAVGPVSTLPRDIMMRSVVAQCLFLRINDIQPTFVEFQQKAWRDLYERVESKGKLVRTSNEQSQQSSFQAHNQDNTAIGIWASNENQPNPKQQRAFRLLVLEGFADKDGGFQGAMGWKGKMPTLKELALDEIRRMDHQTRQAFQNLFCNFEDFSLEACITHGMPKRVSLIDLAVDSEYPKQVICFERVNLGFRKEGDGIQLSEFGLTSSMLGLMQLPCSEGDYHFDVQMQESLPGIHMQRAATNTQETSGSDTEVLIKGTNFVPKQATIFLKAGTNQAMVKSNLNLPEHTLQKALDSFNNSMIGGLTDIKFAKEILKAQ